MGRKEAIARSVVRAITRRRPTQDRSANRLGRILALFSAFFSLYQLPLHKIRPVEFQNIRSEHWNVNDDDYVAAFLNEERDAAALRGMGDMGFSGSVSSDNECSEIASPNTDNDPLRHSSPPGTNNIS